MAIGTAAAIGLGVAGIGSAIGGMSSNKAAGKASDIAAQTARENNALTREIYGQNSANLTPFMQTGMGAMGNINALLGIAPQAAPGSAGQANWGSYLQANPDVLQGYYTSADKNQFSTPEQYAEWHYGQYGANEGRQLPTQAMGAAGGVSQPSANQAFDQYRNSTGYQFRLNQGMDAVNSGYAGAGTIKSGAAMKGINDYGQGMASQEFGNYINALGNQQALGLSGASALAGVGQNFANTISANNNSAGTAAANAALSKQNPLANSMSMIGGGLFGYGSK